MCLTGSEFHLRHVKLKMPLEYAEGLMKKEDRNMGLRESGRTDLRLRIFRTSCDWNLWLSIRSVSASIQKDAYVTKGHLSF